MVDERLERIGDLPCVAHVVVEDQRRQRNRRRAVSVEDALAFIGEDIQATGFVVLEGRQQRIPPGVREVLCLVDDDRVEAMSGLELRCQLGHLERQVVLPELHGLVCPERFVGSFRCAPKHTESMELTDIGRTLPPRPGRADAL